MKSLLLTAMLGMGVAHSGAFLSVWELSYVEDHFTITDLGRKLNKVFKWGEFNDSLRDARTEARDKNIAIYDEPGGKPVENKSRGYYAGHWEPMRSSSTTRY